MAEINLTAGWLRRDVNRAALFVAREKARLAKERMDEAEVALELAQAEWMAAVREEDKLEASVYR